MFVSFLECLRLWKKTRSVLEKLRVLLLGEESAARHLEGEADDNDSFVDIMSRITLAGGAESEGWIFADALLRANLSVETLAEGCC